MNPAASPPGRVPLPARAFLLVPLLLAAGGLAACGHHHDHPHAGIAVVDNRTDLTTNEKLMTFRMAGFGLPFSADILGGDLPVLSARTVGSFEADYYDGQGDLELGQLIEWFDLWVGDGASTVFEVR